MERYNCAPTYRVDLMSGSPDSLERRRDGKRGTGKHYFIEFADIDAELQRARGDDAAQVSSLEFLLDEGPDLPGKRSVMRVREFPFQPLVQ